MSDLMVRTCLDISNCCIYFLSLHIFLWYKRALFTYRWSMSTNPPSPHIDYWILRWKGSSGEATGIQSGNS